ncbi:phytoene/squalene synthetase [Streptomyces sp. V4I8]
MPDVPASRMPSGHGEVAPPRGGDGGHGPAPLPGGRYRIAREPALRAAYEFYRRQTRRDPAQYALIQLAPAPLRPACWALWAAANAVDDLADDRRATVRGRAVQVEAWITALDRDLAAGTSADLVRRALVDTVWRWRLDLSGLRGAMDVVRGDVGGRSFADWAARRAWGRGSLLPWFELTRDLLDRAGAPVTLRLDRQEGYERFLDGFRLTDVLTDLAADLPQDDLLVPDEALAGHSGAAADLRRLRWNDGVAALVADLTMTARRWTAQPGLTRGMHPGPAIILDTMAALLYAQLDAFDAAGPRLLRTAPRPGVATSARILAPARLRASLAWKLTRTARPAASTPPSSTRRTSPPACPTRICPTSTCCGAPAANSAPPTSFPGKPPMRSCTSPTPSGRTSTDVTCGRPSPPAADVSAVTAPLPRREPAAGGDGENPWSR